MHSWECTATLWVWLRSVEPSLRACGASLIGQQVNRTGWLKNPVEQVLRGTGRTRSRLTDTNRQAWQRMSALSPQRVLRPEAVSASAGPEWADTAGAGDRTCSGSLNAPLAELGERKSISPPYLLFPYLCRGPKRD